jgi:hypothetical protein
MARKTKKAEARTALVEALAARAAQLAERDANAAVVREFLKRIDASFSESVEDGKICFEGNYLTDEGLVSILPWKVSVSDDLVMLSCRMPLRVPESKRTAIAVFANEFNAEGSGIGTLFVSKKDGAFQYQHDLPPLALKSDPDAALGDNFLIAMDTMTACSTALLEIIMDASAPDSGGNCDKGEANSKESAGGERPKVESKGGSKKARHKPSRLAANYSLDGIDIKSDVPLDQIVAAVCRFRKTGRSSEAVPRLSILLSGPSGCGKTEFVKYLGERAGAEIVVVTASDVLRSLVGETEQRIADVFRKASEKHAILFFDEVDGLLYDRKCASYGWERVQTNELLQQMERFTGVLVCATNLVEHLDSAIMRRFTFKVQMSALDDEGKVKFFRRYFKSALTDEDRSRLVSIPNLTPGDFRTVRERLYFLGKERGADNMQLLSALEAESACKKNSRMPIGFVR